MESDSADTEFRSIGSVSQEAQFLDLVSATAAPENNQPLPGRSTPANPVAQPRPGIAPLFQRQGGSSGARNDQPSARALGKQRASASEPSSTDIDDSGPEGYSADSGSDDEYSAVEALPDTESDSSQKPSREPSFAFSQSRSLNSSMTSLGSTGSIDVATGRKRTLEWEDTWTPMAAKLRSGKQQKLAKQGKRSQQENTPGGSTASTSAAPQTGTSSHTSVASEVRRRGIEDAIASSPSTPRRPRQAVLPESPTPYRQRMETPTMNRMCDMLNQSTDLDNSAQVDGVYFIAHSGEAQHLMDELHIAWGVQYEIARGVSRGWWSWGDVTRARLLELTGKNIDAAAKVSQVFSRPSGLVTTARAEAELWAELDREELAICEGRNRGLGLQGEWQDTEDWYGGKVQQAARLEEDRGTLRLVLAPMEMHKSNRFARFLGSRRILQVPIPQDMRNNQPDRLREFFKQKFVLCGRVFVAFAAKEGKVFLMETNEDYERGAAVPGDRQRMSLDDFVEWHNPMSKNGKQAVSKWATRFDLGLSTSLPALEFDPEKMFNIDDECVTKVIGKKPKTEEIYTDGCGFMNGAALSMIGRRMGYSTRPTAVQGRIAGAKGLWMLHPSAREHEPHTEPKIWIRDSQRKILLDFNALHPAHRIFDLVAPPRVTLPSRLSRLTILNLAHNGVPTATFAELMRETLEEEVRALTRWSRPEDMQLLWDKVNKLGHVTASRVQQYALGASRALGLSGRPLDEDVPLEEPADPLQELFGGEKLSEEDRDALLAELEGGGAIPQRLRDRFTGEPLTIHGVVLDLLQAGFHPLELSLLYDKMKFIVTKVIEGIIRDFHISVPLSAEAFIVPDPYGILKPGEIHFRSTRDLKSPLEDLHPNILLGEVLIYRNPCRLPSDIQKVTAIQHERLADYTDVIVLPTTGPCSFASMLAGGDYDGDVCVCIYDPRLVESFKNSPLSCEPDNFRQDNFQDQSQIEQVADVATEMFTMFNDPDARRKKLQHVLLSDIVKPPIGKYSVFHENSAYANGYDAPETIRHAFMFNTILDSRKSGLRVRDDVFRRDKREFDRKRPECLLVGGADDPDRPDNLLPLKRDPRLGPFVLDELMARGKELRNEHLHRYDRLKDASSFNDIRDPDLLQPYKRAAPFIHHHLCKDDLALVQKHVNDHIALWQKLASESKNPRTPARRSGRARGRGAGTSRSTFATPAEKRDKWKELGQSFAAGPVLSSESLVAGFADMEELKASWAYHSKPTFAWKVAFQTLCRLKATGKGAVAMTAQFADTMSMSASAVRVLERSREGMA